MGKWENKKHYNFLLRVFSIENGKVENVICAILLCCLYCIGINFFKSIL